jgi:Spy/CpxP family protein refolding chaperone
MRILNPWIRTAALAALAGGLALAQSAPPAAAPQARHGHMGHRGGHRGEFRKLMAGYLGLSADQQTKAQAIFTASRQSAQPLREQLRQARQDLRAAVRDGKPVDQLAANQGVLMGKLAALRANAAEQFRALLTPEQVQKLDALHTGRGRQS